MLSNVNATQITYQKGPPMEILFLLEAIHDPKVPRIETKIAEVISFNEEPSVGGIWEAEWKLT